MKEIQTAMATLAFLKPATVATSTAARNTAKYQVKHLFSSSVSLLSFLLVSFLLVSFLFLNLSHHTHMHTHTHHTITLSHSRSLTFLPLLQRLFSPDRWEELVTQFQHDNYAIHSLTHAPLLDIYLQAGLSALKSSYVVACCVLR